jgi:hypothetical protein
MSMRDWNLESNILKFWTEPMLGSCVDAAHVYSTAARDTVANQEATIQLVEISKLSWKRFQTWTSSITTCHLYILRFFFCYSITTAILEDWRKRRRFLPFRPAQQSAALTHEYAEWLRIESIDGQPDFCIAVSPLDIFPHVITPSYAIIFF